MTTADLIAVMNAGKIDPAQARPEDIYDQARNRNSSRASSKRQLM